jgi:hypothetical protein
VKCLSRNPNATIEEPQLVKALERNFGGLPKEMDKVFLKSECELLLQKHVLNLFIYFRFWVYS